MNSPRHPVRAVTTSTAADSPEATQQDDDDPHEHQQDGAEQHLAVPIDGESHRGENRGAEVEDQRRLLRAQAEIEQPVMQVFGIGGGDRLAPNSPAHDGDRKSTRLNSSHMSISYAVFCLKK